MSCGEGWERQFGLLVGTQRATNVETVMDFAGGSSRSGRWDLSALAEGVTDGNLRVGAGAVYHHQRSPSDLQHDHRQSVLRRRRQAAPPALFAHLNQDGLPASAIGRRFRLLISGVI